MQIEETYKMPIIRAEEDSDGEVEECGIGFTTSLRKKGIDDNNPITKAYAEALSKLISEREMILQNEKLTSKEKINLLEANRRMLFTIKGGRIVKSDQIVFGILAFGAIVLIILALLTSFAGLSHEVTLSFVGTVLGGTIATIAQKLGRL